MGLKINFTGWLVIALIVISLGEGIAIYFITKHKTLTNTADIKRTYDSTVKHINDSLTVLWANVGYIIQAQPKARDTVYKQHIVFLERYRDPEVVHATLEVEKHYDSVIISAEALNDNYLRIIFTQQKRITADSIAIVGYQKAAIIDNKALTASDSKVKLWKIGAGAGFAIGIILGILAH